ncbi:hypothetical protein [Paenibacillus wenxiniae]|uniref:Uncharacterized protein n=1 Tax=Paenibacillus wenxiniae TaxID=1636843 RepID=A0ABW4RJQ0_9BACL
MHLYNLEIIYSEKAVALPMWIKFAFAIGYYLVESNKENGKRTNIAITVPHDEYFALFAAMGIAETIYSSNNNSSSLREHILKLKKGNRIIYKTGNLARKVSVVSIGESPIDNNEMMLHIQDKNFTQGIPERQWQEKIFLLNEQYEVIKRTRIMSDREKIGIDSPLLNRLYTKQQLRGTTFFPIEAFQLVGNKNKLINQMNERIFFSGEIQGSIRNFLFVEELNNNSSYSNGKFISSLARKSENRLLPNTPVLYSDALSFRKQGINFKKNPFLGVISRSDYEDLIHEVTSEITRSIIQGKDVRYLTNHLLNSIENQYRCLVPDGVELVAWRETIE